MEVVNIQSLETRVGNLGKQGKNFLNRQIEGETHDFSSILKGQLSLGNISSGNEELVDNLLSFLNLDEETGEEEVSLEDLSLFMENLLKTRESQSINLNLGEDENLENTVDSLKEQGLSILNDIVNLEEKQAANEKNITLGKLGNKDFKDNLKSELEEVKSELGLDLNIEEKVEEATKLLSLEKDLDLKGQENKGGVEGQNFSSELKILDQNSNTNFENITEASGLKFMEDNIESLRENLIGNIDTLKDGEATTIKVKLTPRELGEVDIDIKLENGKLVGRILVESQRVQEMFIRNMAELTENLNKGGANFEEIEIDLKQNLSDFNDGNQGFQGQEGARQNSQRNFINRLVKNKGISEIPSLGLDRKTKNPYDLQANNLNILV